VIALAQKLGPGLLFAAVAVGVSHIVQSTRAGADFGLSMAVLIILACAVKYPAFRFAAEYSASAKESIIAAYERQGRWLLVFFLIAIAVEGLAVIPAVSLVAAGMMMNFFGFEANEILMTTAIIASASLGLAFGRYRLLENISRVFVVLFTVLTIVATVVTVGALGDGRPIAAPIPLTRQTLFSSVALAGWMPVGMGGAVFLSLWVLAKSRALGRPVAINEVRFDFNIGYVATVVLALCFLLMGTALLLERGIDLSESSVVFAAQLFTLFTESVGAWVRPVIGIAALAVMFSTVLTVIDGFPRVYADVVNRLLRRPAEQGEDRFYLPFMIFQGLVALLLLAYFLSSFGVFINFSTTAGFLTAPVIAFLNHRVISSASVAVEHRPPPWLKMWSACGVAVLTGTSIAYLYFRFF
jgi:Mn2+/Fe2+ NRAMP family transporter